MFWTVYVFDHDSAEEKCTDVQGRFGIAVYRTAGMSFRHDKYRGPAPNG